MSLTHLPPELLLKIFELVSHSSLLSLARVSRFTHAVSLRLLYATVQHTAWKPRRVSACLNTLASSWDVNLAPTVRHLDLRLYSIDPAFARLLLDALAQTTGVIKLKLTMAEKFAQNLDALLLSEGLVASESPDEPHPQAWTKRFLPNLQHLEISSGHLPFRLAAGRPVRTVVSSTHIDLEPLRSLLPFLQRARGPLQSVHFNITGRDARVASHALRLVAKKLPYLTQVFFNFFVSKRSNPPKYTPDLLEDLAPLSSLHTVELLLSRHARSPDTYLYSHFAAVHTLKATAPHLTTVVLDTIHWQYMPPPSQTHHHSQMSTVKEYTPSTIPPTTHLTHTPTTSIASSSSSPHSTSPPAPYSHRNDPADDPDDDDAHEPLISKFDDTETLPSTQPPPTAPAPHPHHDTISDGTYGWSPEPADIRTHAWWLSQYGNQGAAHGAMVALWGGRTPSCPSSAGHGEDRLWCIPEPHEIGMGLYGLYGEGEMEASGYGGYYTSGGYGYEIEQGDVYGGEFSGSFEGGTGAGWEEGLSGGTM